MIFFFSCFEEEKLMFMGFLLELDLNFFVVYMAIDLSYSAIR